jgi:2-methylcitrate dehydratase PrpD
MRSAIPLPSLCTSVSARHRCRPDQYPWHRQGFTGAPALTCEGAQAEPFWTGLGEQWLVLEHTHFKLYPCCRWAHSSLDGVLHLMREHPLVHGDVARVEIRTFHYGTRLAGHEPKTLDELSFSIAFPVAAMIVRRTIGPAKLIPKTFLDPDILRLSRTTVLIADPEMTAQEAARTTATMRNTAANTAVSRDTCWRNAYLVWCRARTAILRSS